MHLTGVTGKDYEFCSIHFIKELVVPRSLATALGLAVAMCAAQPAAAAETKRILAFGDSNTWGYVPRDDGAATTRYPADVRWTGILDRELGEDYEVIEDGLNLRTTNLDGEEWTDSIIRPHTFNGAAHLPASLAAHMPLDLVIIMLGTNDLQAVYERSPEEVATAAIDLARQVQASSGGIGNSYPAPKVLLLSPVGMAEIPVPDMAARYAGGQEKSTGLARAFQVAAGAAQIPMLDAASVIGGVVGGADGLHLSEAEHRALAQALVPEVKALLAE